MRTMIGASEEQFARMAADVLGEVVANRPDAAIGLPSGRTPLSLYDELARRVDAGVVDLSAVTAFAIDELYGVPPEHSATNATYFAERVSSRIPLRALHVMASDPPDSDAECARFARLIEDAGGLEIALVGIGRNGHIAFNEPGSPFDSQARLVELSDDTRAPYIEGFGSLAATPSRGLTLGIADLRAARRVVLVALGAGKADIVSQALEGAVTEALPASVLRRHPHLTVVLDQPAGSRLTRWHESFN
ncbi:MAG: glucosamine-6-phosphate deaminase [Dehalococcoidia bacterium]